MDNINKIFLTISALAIQGCLSVAPAQYTYNYYYPPSPSSTPWAPSWSPDGARLAVSMLGSIWDVDPETGAASELISQGRYDSSPDWSPDGKWIVYTSQMPGKSIQLALHEVSTGDSRLLTSDSHTYLDPVFSPDGRRIAYVSTAPNRRFHLYVRAIREGQWDGDPVPVTTDNRYARERLYVGAWDMHIQPAWTPDSKELVFVGNRDSPLGSGDIWRMPAERDGIRKAVPVWREQSLFRTRPHVSIDGKRVLYSSHGGGIDQFNHLYVVPITGGAPYKLTYGDFDHFHPRWSPDGEKIAFVSNEGGLPQLHVMETYGGGPKKIAIGELRWKRPMGKLRVRVVDAATGMPAPARIHALASDGKFYPPRNVYARIERSGEPAFHTSGEFVLEAPPGKIGLEAVRGLEYWPAKLDVHIKAHATAGVELKLRRMANEAARGWYSGTTHSHMNYGGNLRNSPENMVAMARAEDLRVVMALVANKDNRVLDRQYFIAGGGGHPASQRDPDVYLHVGEEYRPPLYGHVSLLGLRDHLISPFTTGYEGTAIESLYPSNTNILRKARAQGALTTYLHPFAGDNDPLEGDLGHAKALPVDAALGTVDCLEWTYINSVQMAVWHHLLNNDIVLTPVGGEDSITDLHRGKQIGSVRTYARVDGPLTIESCLGAIRKGRTYFTSGPILDFQINGKLPGEILRLPASGGAVTLEGTVRSIAPLSKVSIHSNGRVWKEIPLDNDGKSAAFREVASIAESGWFSLYSEGPPNGALDGEFPQAATNVVRVYVGEKKIRNRASAEYFLRWMDKLTTMTEEWPWWRSETEKSHVLSEFAQARKAYETLAREAQ